MNIKIKTKSRKQIYHVRRLTISMLANLSMRLKSTLVWARQYLQRPHMTAG